MIRVFVGVCVLYCDRKISEALRGGLPWEDIGLVSEFVMDHVPKSKHASRWSFMKFGLKVTCVYINIDNTLPTEKPIGGEDD